MSLFSKINVSVNADESSPIDLGSRVYNMKKSKLLTLLDGSGLGQANKVYADSVSVAQSVNTDLDLSGTLAGAFGNVVFTALKALLVVAGDSNPGNLTVGNVTNGIVAWFGAATHSLVCTPGGIILLADPSAAGRTVTAGTADLLRIATPATVGTYTFDVAVVGI
jgi:hypothetical protein